MADYTEILVRNYSGSSWTMHGNDYNTLEWHSESSKPTQQELDDAWPAVQQAQQEEAAAEEATRQSAIEKLAALGLSVDEIRVAFGLEGS